LRAEHEWKAADSVGGVYMRNRINIEEKKEREREREEGY
jgi:hypothetical protein